MKKSKHLPSQEVLYKKKKNFILKEQNIQNYEKGNIILRIKLHNQNKFPHQIYNQILRQAD